MVGDIEGTRIPHGKYRTIKLDGIQIVRALAASLVVADHSLLTVGSHDKSLAWLMGAVGVWLFFIVSGVIMHHTTKDDNRGVRSAKLFITRRLIRVIPLYWIFTFALVVQAFVRARELRVEWIVKSLLFIPYLDSEGQIHPIIQQGWTLNYEIVFYLLFSVSLLIPRRAGILLLFTALGILAALSLTPLSMPWKAWADPVVVLFGVGVSVSMLRPKMHFGGSLRPYLPSLILGGTLLTIFLLWRIPNYPPSLVAHCLAWLACSVIVMMAAHVLHGGGHLARTAEALGDASYSTYLCHNIVIYPIFKLIGHNIGADLAIPIMIIGANVAGLMVFRFVESPLNKQLRNSVRKLDSAAD